ncbi:hypothetical protein LPU83_pLPU83b_0485 (plasmid) [Rhizobium favelukesii]|uniref:Uncharacterized protein n=1 Tax=Rhizobium favelukesii TaxID=348824 RepID=W6RNQ0_9HYPH|nr:hypothetical protein LPU83_pLPU83b_0485 [Rhizobium favelukesii]
MPAFQSRYPLESNRGPETAMFHNKTPLTRPLASPHPARRMETVHSLTSACVLNAGSIGLRAEEIDEVRATGAFGPPNSAQVPDNTVSGVAALNRVAFSICEPRGGASDSSEL